MLPNVLTACGPCSVTSQAQGKQPPMFRMVLGPLCRLRRGCEGACAKRNGMDEQRGQRVHEWSASPEQAPAFAAPPAALPTQEPAAPPHQVTAVAAPRGLTKSGRGFSAPMRVVSSQPLPRSLAPPSPLAAAPGPSSSNRAPPGLPPLAHAPPAQAATTPQAVATAPPIAIAVSPGIGPFATPAPAGSRHQGRGWQIRALLRVLSRNTGSHRCRRQGGPLSAGRDFVRSWRRVAGASSALLRRAARALRVRARKRRASAGRRAGCGPSGGACAACERQATGATGGVAQSCGGDRRNRAPRCEEKREGQCPRMHCALCA